MRLYGPGQSESESRGQAPLNHSKAIDNSLVTRVNKYSSTQHKCSQDRRCDGLRQIHSTPPVSAFMSGPFESMTKTDPSSSNVSAVCRRRIKR